jgi:hypothetical protein
VPFACALAVRCIGSVVVDASWPTSSSIAAPCPWPSQVISSSDAELLGAGAPATREEFLAPLPLLLSSQGLPFAPVCSAEASEQLLQRVSDADFQVSGIKQACVTV